MTEQGLIKKVEEIIRIRGPYGAQQSLDGLDFDEIADLPEQVTQMLIEAGAELR